jgi:hypothetical protein
MLIDTITTTTYISTCTVEQELLFGENDGVMGTEIDANDLTPLGLWPFVNGSFASVPISDVSVVYELNPGMYYNPYSGTLGFVSEYHVVGWQSLTFSDVFSIPTCITPTLSFTGCPSLDGWVERGPSYIDPCDEWTFIVFGTPVWTVDTLWCKFQSWYQYFRDWWGYLFSFWFQWLWCHLLALLLFLIASFNYVQCVTQQTISIVGNTTLEFIYRIYADFADYFNGLSNALIDFFTQFGVFISQVSVPEVAAWLTVMRDCIADHIDAWLPAYTSYLTMVAEEVGPWLGTGASWLAGLLNAWLPAITDFLTMAVGESAQWLLDLLDWIANDVFTATWTQVFRVANSVIEGTGALSAFITRQFAATLRDMLNMMSFSLKIVLWLINLTTGLVAGLQDALSDDTQAEIFTSITYFARGLDLFEELVGGTPLALLNLISIGLIGLNLVPWTLKQVIYIVDVLTQAVGE